MCATRGKIEPYLMALLASRIGSISVQMNNIMVKSARSSVLALARDCSTAICDRQGDVIAFPSGFPVHVGATSLAGHSLLELYGDDLRRGDAYLNNSPYHGNTHAADHTILVPVFYEDELMFICICRGHQADIGNSIPTTYHAKARDVYEEGALIFPCVRIQRDYKDNQDIIRMCKMRIRVPEVWYGDYLAMIGAARIGERELTNLITRYGKDTIQAFSEQWHAYGRQRMIEEIRKFPAGTAYYETKHDPIPGVIPDGVNVKVKLTVDPEEGYITCDFTDNEDSMPCGLNLCEATLSSAARTGVLNRMSASDLPHCEGALGRIVVKMGEGSVVGKAKHPFSSSVATTNVNDRAVVAVQCAFNQLTDRMGMAEPHYDMGPSLSVISGTDSRYGNRRYVTQLISGVSGSAGVNGHDGYLHHANSNGGMFYTNSVEMVEKHYPVLYIQQEVLTDGVGSGKWDGAPSVKTVIRTMKDPVTFVYMSDGHDNPARGASGGLDGLPAQAFLSKVKHGTETEVLKELPTIHEVTLQPGEALSGICSSAGGYGDPLERDPELVRHRVREGWVSSERARDVYGVVLDLEPELYAVDWKATQDCRREFRDRRNRGNEKGH
jgi:N-methylhydantoinase B